MFFGCATVVVTPSMPESFSAGLAKKSLPSSLTTYTAPNGLCGAYALHNVLRTNGIDSNISELVQKTFIPKKDGAISLEMLSTVGSYGLLAVVLPPNLESILWEINDGNAVVALIDTATFGQSVWHYTVVGGYDLDSGTVFLADLGWIPIQSFKKMASKSDFYSFALVLPPKLPHARDALKLVGAIEKIRHAGFVHQAKAAYMQALGDDSYNVWYMFALANIYMDEALYREAKELYLELLKHEPNHVAALNNLANCYLRIGDFKKARSAAQKALKIGGFDAQVATTLDQIDAAMPKQHTKKGSK